LLFRTYKFLQEEIFEIPGRTIAVVGGISLVFLPFFVERSFLLLTFAYAAIFSIYAVSWDLLAGFTGQVSLGHAALFGTGAYVTALLNVYLGLPIQATIPLGAIAALLVGLIVAIPSFRLRGYYFSLASLAFPIILTGIVLAFTDFTGGELGISGLTPLSHSYVSTYYIAFTIMIASALIMWKISDARSRLLRLGIILAAIRDDEVAARVAGINTPGYKLVVFIISAFFAGLAGALYAHTMRIAGPSSFELLMSLYPVLWTVFGGMASIYGPIVGTYIIYPAMQVFAFAPELRIIIVAILMLLVIVFMPEGISIWVRDKLEENCPRCKLVNFTLRRTCRACGALLHLEREEKS
jgi:branched-chain amino acid transport system permease protein